MRKAMTVLAAWWAFSTASGQTLPDPPNPAKHYLFYLHGRIIKDGDVRPVHETWGLYDYPAVVRALGSGGAVVVSEQRAQDTDIADYAAKVRRQIEALVEAGVPQSHITVVGFSKGGAIAITVSGGMGEHYADIRYVFLAACADWVLDQPALSLSGRVLTVSEATDDATSSCGGLEAHARTLTEGAEVTINTGAGHGAFYLPREVWVEPTLQWAHRS